MARVIVPENPPAKKAPERVVPILAARTAVLRAQAALSEKVDHLGELRALLREADVAERELTAEVVRALQASGVARLAGHTAVATLDERTTLRPDPQQFHEALGTASFAAMTVSVTAARKLMGADDLLAISETTTSPVLRVEAVQEVA